MRLVGFPCNKYLVRLRQGPGPLVVPPGVVVLHFVKDLTKALAIGAHKVGCRKVTLLVLLLVLLLALDIKFFKCISYIYSVRNLD